ncbi:MAG: RagB/SusD family nutrient uptake outer membrane protein [Candidatus Ordinivivax streblomastigis]|uniref:RagB/SusD family nutrient uptake outer membrane protein n=1 Tax=Candidatus Ordinivivax streblomastigis TaxID=2540710 RepID=A0A5M8NU36_9BACT|nr:MAG: RagB/SusD family nutrient uptake outer membrane protein [Candidatus Ordinivivax streblomastigis]
MKKIKYISYWLFSCTILVLLTGCEDFLNRTPLSAGTEAIFFNSPSQFAQAANNLYQLGSWSGINVDGGTDISGLGSNGGGSAPESSGNWSSPYTNIRPCNILLQKAAEYTGAQEEIAASVGTARFFRAWQHFSLLQRFGGVPIADHVFDLSDPVVRGPRNSRYEVTKFIIDDLRTAIPLLPKEKDIATADKGKVSMEIAKAFLSRVLLYEATWEKYVIGFEYDLDGDGTQIGAGTAKPAGYPSITEMFTEAKQWSGEVITEAEAGTFALWNLCDSLSYYYVFSIDEKGGNWSNFRNLGKATNKEFLFSIKYDYDVKKGGYNLAHTIGSNQLSQMSAYMGELYLCQNGLPIHVSNSATRPANATASDNPQFLGLSTFIGEYRNRDYRFIGTVIPPDRTSWCSKDSYGTQNKGLPQPYPTPVYPQVPYNPNDPAFSSKDAIYNPNLLSGGTHSGYRSRKFMPEGANRTDNQESPDYPLIRLAEVYLNYAEATVELGNGVISNTDLDRSINKLRDRAGVAHLTNELIAGKWDCGWWDHETNKTISKQMNMLDEIRRERTVELYAEGFRQNDLKRWGIAHFALTGQKLGRYVLNTAYTTEIANDATFHGQPCYQPDAHPLTRGVYDESAGVSPSDPDYGRSIATLADNLLYAKRDYLSAIPLAQIRLNLALTQNPGW